MQKNKNEIISEEKPTEDNTKVVEPKASSEPKIYALSGVTKTNQHRAKHSL